MKGTDNWQSHDYPNTTKGNPIQGRRTSFPSPAPRATPHCVQPTHAKPSDEPLGLGRNRAVSHSQIASMAARFRIAWLEGTPVETKAQGVRGLSPKARKGKRKGGENPPIFVCEL
ncbi:hypothetical protein NUU61_009732 [Penicillium alfredii]|uniref:Uncharacterized protein n=1 Tax=Penicillium alfredii TaxID=1506179 RepID=A0A9W9EGP0_9EURO|nr:uncharacterized protein NUU61_009732 [Penicillium alfredii]KAJ5081468.1 hypothetical protein NUU61_009732 [Penicillium alfredii]